MTDLFRNAAGDSEENTLFPVRTYSSRCDREGALPDDSVGINRYRGARGGEVCTHQGRRRMRWSQRPFGLEVLLLSSFPDPLTLDRRCP